MFSLGWGIMAFFCPSFFIIIFHEYNFLGNLNPLNLTLTPAKKIYQKICSIRCFPIFEIALRLRKAQGFLSILSFLKDWNVNEYAWSIGGMELTVENWSTGRGTCPIATLSTTNLTCIRQGMNSCLCGERPATNRLINEACNCSEKYFELQLVLHNKCTLCSLQRQTEWFCEDT